MSSEGLTAVGSRTSSGFIKLDLAPDGVGRADEAGEAVELVFTTAEGELTGAMADVDSSALFLMFISKSELGSCTR